MLGARIHPGRIDVCSEFPVKLLYEWGKNAATIVIMGNKIDLSLPFYKLVFNFIYVYVVCTSMHVGMFVWCFAIHF